MKYRDALEQAEFARLKNNRDGVLAELEANRKQQSSLRIREYELINADIEFYEAMVRYLDEH